MEDYFAAKQLLFEGAGGAAAAVRRAQSRRRVRRAASKLQPATEVLWYGLGQDADLRARHISSGFQGCASTCSTASCAFPWNRR